MKLCILVERESQFTPSRTQPGPAKGKRRGEGKRNEREGRRGGYTLLAGPLMDEPRRLGTGDPGPGPCPEPDGAAGREDAQDGMEPRAARMGRRAGPSGGPGYNQNGPFISPTAH